VVRTFRLETVLGTLVPPALLGVLALTGGLGVAGWIVGLAAGWTTTALLVTARVRNGDPAVPPADWISLSRALLAAGVAALVADSFDRPLRTAALVALATVALVLDAVDGQVARRTGTATPLGARFDAEADAWLILVLSVAGPATTAAGCSRSVRPGTPCWSRAGCCPGSPHRCRRGTGARSSPP
jgi:phosphatidylglycerophosphate synthase